MRPIIDEIRDKHGEDGIKAYNSLIQNLENLAFKYPPGYSSPVESPSEPEDVSNRRYLDRIDRNRGL